MDLALNMKTSTDKIKDCSKVFCVLRELELYSNENVVEFLDDVCNELDFMPLDSDTGDAHLSTRTSGYGQKLGERMRTIDDDMLDYMNERLKRCANIRNRYETIKMNQSMSIVNKLIPIEDDLMSIEEALPEVHDKDYDVVSPQESDEDYGIPLKRRASSYNERPEKKVKLNELKQWSLFSKKLIRHARRFPHRFNSKQLNSIKDVAKHQITHVDLLTKCKQLTKDVGAFIRKKDKETREHRKKAEKEQFEKTKAEEEKRESARQARKLNFLITQTELYSHFVTKKELDTSHKGNVDFDNEDEELLRQQAESSAQIALEKTRQHANQFNKVTDQPLTEIVQQPSILNCSLKSYQLKGLNWLAGLYEQGINGILADEMGLGKTVQSISLLAYVAEKYNIWGPFLVVTPASTLHNWQNEFSKFIPDFKVVPYWGASKERSSMRSLFRQKGTWTKDSSSHVIVTSYQLAVQDQQYLSKLKWQFLILDEAHAIKSSGSVRWNTLLKFDCRNRLLLTGTPIQNSLHELWALLHFIMPTLFDNHEEFKEWFSRGIESDTKSMNEHQLKRLQAILKPFMLRRVKSDVENELPPKIEIEVPCPLSHHQKRMYSMLKKKVNINDLLEKAQLTSNTDDLLQNLMMHFRKITNHPELFERSDATSPLHFGDILGYSHEESNYVYGYSGSWTNQRYPSLIKIDKTPSKLQSIQPLAFYTDGKYHRFTVAKWLMGEEMVPLGPDAPFSDMVKHKCPIEPFYIPKVTAEPIKLVFGKVSLNKESDQVYKNMILKFGYPLSFWKQHMTVEPVKSNLTPLDLKLSNYLLMHNKPYGMDLQEKKHLSMIKVPGMWDLIRSSGKLLVLDHMLPILKKQGHKVLIYFQMTKMMDIMEEYLQSRQFQHVRLDGSTSIEERNEKVIKFQDSEEIFVFLLSTRAGGVGINLTAADTVIFYDQDWNPTADQQAMDRCHRLGQTRQVTVYRLITQGTVEERVSQMAKRKHDIQTAVIAGGEFKQVVQDLLIDGDE